MKFLLVILAGIGLAACSANSINTAVTDGQLFCRLETANGPLVVAAATVAGAPISVIGQTSAAIASVCAAINAIPVSPPANSSAAPSVAVPGN